MGYRIVLVCPHCFKRVLPLSSINLYILPSICPHFMDIVTPQLLDWLITIEVLYTICLAHTSATARSFACRAHSGILIVNPNSCRPCNSKTIWSICAISNSMELSWPVDMQWRDHGPARPFWVFSSGTQFFADTGTHNYWNNLLHLKFYWTFLDDTRGARFSLIRWVCLGIPGGHPNS